MNLSRHEHRHVGIISTLSLTIRRRRANHSRALVDVSQCAPSPGDAAEEHAFQHAYDSCWFERVSVDVKPSPLVRHWVRG